jgi:hypothetical protein
MNGIRGGCLLLALVLFVPGSVSAQLATECDTSQELDKYKFMRRLSLDLRLVPPTWDEYQQIADKDWVTDEIIDGWMSQPGYVGSMRRMHKDLFWPNPAGSQLSDVQTNLVKFQSDETHGVISSIRRSLYRGGPGLSCGDFPHPEDAYDEDGVPTLMPWTDPQSQEEELVDGWVMRSPYWDPDNPIKVCAFEAQEREMGLSGFSCGDYRVTTEDRSCGCGPDLRYCYGPQIVGKLWADMGEQLLRMVDDVVTGARPYTDLVVSTDIHMNGRLLFWKKYLGGLANFSKTFNHWAPEDGDLPEEPQFSDEEWSVVSRSFPHAGIQTMPAYALRFQTNRARANRFRIAFTSQYFIPSASPSMEGCDPNAEDLTQRCVCRDCHKVLEPMAGHFAPIAEAGTTPIVDPLLFPVFNEKCVSKPSSFCGRFYVTEKDSPQKGVLLSHQFAIDDAKNLCTYETCDTVHANIAANIEAGPAGLVDSVVGSGQFARSTVRNLFRYLLGRDVRIAPGEADDESALLTALAEGFRTGAHGDGQTLSAYDFPGLVRQVIALEQYRRVR